MADPTTQNDDKPTTTADIAKIKVTLRELIEEVSTLLWEKRQFLNGKIERRAIGEPEKNLALLRIRKLEILHAYLKHDAGDDVVESHTPPAKPAPEPEPEPPPAEEEPVPSLDDF